MTCNDGLLSVLQPDKADCLAGRLNLRTGVHSMTADLVRQCQGHSSHPIELLAQPGQRLTLSLLDFSWNENNYENSCPAMYGHVVAGVTNQRTPICGHGRRHKQILQTENHSLKLQITNMDSAFLIIVTGQLDCIWLYYYWMGQWENKYIYVYYYYTVYSQIVFKFAQWFRISTIEKALLLLGQPVTTYRNNFYVLRNISDTTVGLFFLFRIKGQFFFFLLLNKRTDLANIGQNNFWDQPLITIAITCIIYSQDKIKS